MTQAQVETEAPVEEAPALILDLDGDRQTFKAYREANQYLLAKHADNFAQSGLPAVIAVTALVLGQVLPEEVNRLRSYLEAHGHDQEYETRLTDALGACWAGETMLPLERSSASSEPTQTEATD